MPIALDGIRTCISGIRVCFRLHHDGRHASRSRNKHFRHSPVSSIVKQSCMKHSNSYLRVCVCACVMRACVCACVRVYVHAYQAVCPGKSYSKRRMKGQRDGGREEKRRERREKRERERERGGGGQGGSLTDSLKPCKRNVFPFTSTSFISYPLAPRSHCTLSRSAGVYWSILPVLTDLNVTLSGCKRRRPPFCTQRRKRSQPVCDLCGLPRYSTAIHTRAPLRTW